jgi:hypothetical protein
MGTPPAVYETGLAEIEDRSCEGDRVSVSVVENIQRSLARECEEVRVTEAMSVNWSF